MTRSVALLALAAALLVGFALAQGAANQITLRSEIYIVSQVTAEDGTKEERFTAADSAIPGQVVEYRIFAKNEGETTLPAGRVHILGPIPGGTSYVDKSASANSEQLLTEYTVDGEAFTEGPLITTEDGERRMLEPEEVTAIRWTLLIPLEPGQEVSFYYRVLIED